MVRRLALVLVFLIAAMMAVPVSAAPPQSAGAPKCTLTTGHCSSQAQPRYSEPCVSRLATEGLIEECIPITFEPIQMRYIVQKCDASTGEEYEGYDDWEPIQGK